MEMNFCRRCGAMLTQQNQTAYVCTNGHKLYTNPDSSVNIFLLTQDNNVLLGVRNFEPFKGALDSFGGFVDWSETAEEALVREIHEETGLTQDHYDTPQFLCTQNAPYPYEGEVRNTLPIFFWARLKDDATLVANDDVAEIRKVPLFDTDDETMKNMKVAEPFLKLRTVIAKQSL